MLAKERLGVYTPDDDLRIHSENAIRLLCKPFQSHENGLPEWPKNAADEYVRSDAPEDERVIVIIMQNGRANGPSNVIACLDFSGMTSATIENDFRYWADPAAASRRGHQEKGVQGGHGNGGKCYMTQMFDDCAYMHTVRGKRANVYGTVGGSVHLGYFPDKSKGRNIRADNLRAELDEALGEIGLSTGHLPPAAVKALNKHRGFTLMVGRGAKGYGTRIPAALLLANLVEHPQMRMTLEICSVYAIVQKRLYNQGKPLEMPEIPPLPGGEEPRILEIPETLEDPATGHTVSTTAHGKYPRGTLTLRTSRTQMRRGGKKSRHIIVYKAQSGYIGSKPVAEFDVSSTYRDRIYGDCVLMALEPAKMNDRAALAVTPLTRALEDWIASEIEIYAKVFEEHDRRKRGQEERNVLAQINAALDTWKNQLLEKILGETEGAGEEAGGYRPPLPPPLPSGDPARMELSLSFYRAGVGVPMKPKLNAFDGFDKRIRPPAVMWISDNVSVASVDETIGVVNTHAPGEAYLHCETFDQKIASNSVKLEVVDIGSILLAPDTIEVPAGSRRRVNATCTLSSGEEANDVALLWLENDPSVAQVSASGLVFGFAEGATEVTASDDRVTAENRVCITVLPGNTGGGSSNAYPRVLVSEIDPDPDTGAAVILSPDDPPVHQRPHDFDRNIWWINSASPLAQLYLLGKDFGPESREWRIYHVERYIDVIVQITMSQGPEAEDQLDVGEWAARWGEHAADIQGSAADGLAAFIADGELPS
jgi:hypothetical protein